MSLAAAVRFLGTITAADYWAGGDLRALADELLAALHLDPNEVTEIVVSCAAITVDLIDRRTLTHRIVRYPWTWR